MRIVFGAWLVALSLSALSWAASDPSKAKDSPVAALFEDGADDLLKLLTNPGDGGGQGDGDKIEVFSGKESLKITHYQRFHRKLPGWNYAIRAKPKPGEYRYLRFAWKSAAGNCVMLQLHDTLDWNIRYTAGANVFGWATKFVADKPPRTWTLVTIDLFKDFGERDLTGIAFTMDGGPAHFDHVYLGRTIDDLDRIDADGLAAKKLALSDQELKGLWDDLIAPDAAVAYRSFWRLVAGRERSGAFIKEKLAAPAANGVASKQLRQWIDDLDSDMFKTREKASTELKIHLAAAVPLLEAELAKSPSAEVTRRIEKLLAGRIVDGRETQRIAKARLLQKLGAELNGK